MKAFRLLLAFALLLPLHPLHAEIEERALMSVNIPFAFTVDNTRLPAGRYVIYSVNHDHLWRLSSFRRGATAFFAVSTDPTLEHRVGQSQLTFRRYGTEYVLHEIDSSPDRTKATLFVGKRERQLQRSDQSDIAMIDIYADKASE